MNKDVTVTICMPTYNRRNTVVKRLQEMKFKGLPENISVLIIDNYSDDGTFEALIENNIDGNYRIHRNEKNLGYAGNFFELLDKCLSEYAIFMSDEDELLYEGLQRICNFISNERPDFVSPIAEIDGKVYRGRNKISKIKPAEFNEASFYLSGLVYRTDISRRYSGQIKDLLDSNAAAHTYPQVLLTSIILSVGKGYWFDDVVTKKREQLYSHILNPDGGEYYHLIGRFQQTLGFIDFFDSVLNNPDTEGCKMNMTVMKQVVESRLLNNLRNGLYLQRPELVPAFDRSCLGLGLSQYLAFRLLKRVSLAFRYPNKILPYLVRILSKANAK
jgi:glycosyltransferase involved in cell wall biosynthesis